MNSHPSSKSSARDVFSYLLLIAMFIVGVVSFLILIFQYVNIQFPDALTSDYWYREGALTAIRGAISAILVAWPVVILMSIFIGKDLRANVEKQYMWIRKWLLHLLLFVSAITIIIDLITLINTFLDGEITTRFVLKVLAVLIVAVAVFWYQLWELRRDVAKTTKSPMWAAVGSSVVILAMIAASLFVVGSPSSQRDARLDQERISDLQSIQNALVNFYRDKDLLPESLVEIEDDIIGYRNPTDPETQIQYSYSKMEDLSFSLCAIFKTESAGMSSPNRVYYEFGPLGGNFDVWDHGTGEVCFERTIDPDRINDKAFY
jgi:type II secretory pathway pseudopilin PulG